MLTTIDVTYRPMFTYAVQKLSITSVHNSASRRISKISKDERGPPTKNRSGIRVWTSVVECLLSRWNPFSLEML